MAQLGCGAACANGPPLAPLTEYRHILLEEVQERRDRQDGLGDPSPLPPLHVKTAYRHSQASHHAFERLLPMAPGYWVRGAATE